MLPFLTAQMLQFLCSCVEDGHTSWLLCSGKGSWSSVLYDFLYSGNSFPFYCSLCILLEKTLGNHFSSPLLALERLTTVMIVLNCKLDWIWKHQGGTFLDVSMRMFPERFYYRRKTQPECRRHHPMDLGLGLNKRRK